MNPEEADEFLDSLEVGLKQGFKIPRKSKDQVEKEKKDKQERIRNEEEAAAKRAAEDISIKKRPKHSSFKPTFDSKDPVVKPTFDSKDPLGLISRPDEGYGNERATTLIRSLYIDDIPEELAELCPARRCRLCGIKTLNSDTHARSHYLGKQHSKKAQAWLDEWSGRTKMPVPKLKSLVLDEDPNFCTLCNLDLSSDITALTHYQGENHAKNLRKLNAGTLDPNDRGFGIGLGFRPQDNTGSKRKSDGDADHSAAKIVKKVQSSGQKSRTYCTTCKRDCNTRDEYKVHMMSTAHAAQVAMAPSTSCMPEKAAPIIITTPQRHSGIIKKAGSVFVCHLCKVDCNSDTMLEAHVNGKSHRKRRAQEAPVTAPGIAPGIAPGTRFRCDLCQIETTDQRGLDDHKKGKKHLKKLVDGGGY